MSKRISLVFILFCIFTITSVNAKDKFTLVIDAGHGGKDAGALGACSKEKDINLNVALAFGKYVEENLNDVKVVYTRKTDIFIPLKGRAEIANKAKADLFVSVHTNSVLPTKNPPKGFQVYTLGMHRAKDNLDVAMRENSVISLEKGYKRTYEGFDPNSSESYIMFEILQSANMERSVEMARLIQSYVCQKANRNDKGVHQAGFLVLRETSMPSCLIELGFITHPEEEQFLNSPEGIDLMARGIYEAFVEYKNRYHGKIQIPYRSKVENKVMQAQVLSNIVNNEKKTIEQPVRENKIKVKPQLLAEKNKVSHRPQAKKNVEEKKTEEKKTERKKIEDKKVEGKKVEIKKTEDKKIEGKKVEDKKVERKKTEDKKVEGKKITVKKAEEKKADAPIFKIQVFAINRQLSSDSSQLKEYADTSYFVEGNLYKYTIGNCTDYNEVLQLQKKVRNDFPEAFIVAFRDGKRISISKALKDLKNKNK